MTDDDTLIVLLEPGGADRTLVGAPACEFHGEVCIWRGERYFYDATIDGVRQYRRESKGE